MAIEEQTQYDTIIGISDGGAAQGLGQYLIIPDREVVKLAFPLCKYGSPTGDVTFNIRRGIDQSLICSKVWGDAADLPTYPTIIWAEVEFDDPQTINDVVIIEFVFTGGDAGNQLFGQFMESDVKAGENKVRYVGGDWFQDSLEDAAYRYTYTVLVAPTVTTDPATSVAANSAILNGTLDGDGGEACDCGFEWGETLAYGNTTPTQSKETGESFSQAISGLDPKKTYHFRAFATNSEGTGYGANRTFTTLATAPTVDTDPAIDINNNSATLKGELTYDGGEACNCGFEYGETEAYGTTTPTQSKVTGEAFSQPITGLDANKTYHFRAIATNSAGTSHGADRTFKTLVAAPAVTTNPATGLGAVLATLNGTLDDDIGEACDCGFEWGLDTDYGTITPTESKATGETFSQMIGGLFPNTVYHFRAFATNSAGTGHGADRTFTTALVISRAYALAREEL